MSIQPVFLMSDIFPFSAILDFLRDILMPFLFRPIQHIFSIGRYIDLGHIHGYIKAISKQRELYRILILQ